MRARVRDRLTLGARFRVSPCRRTGAASGPRDDERHRGALDEFEGRSPAGAGIGRGVGVGEREATLQRTG